MIFQILKALGCSADSLNRPAREVDLVNLDAAFRGRTPGALRLMHEVGGGESDRCNPAKIFFGYKFLSVQEMLVERDVWDDVRATEKRFGSGYHEVIPSWPPRAIKDVYSSDGWISFASTGGGAQLAVDLDPDIEGVVGQVISFGPDDLMHFQLARSFDEFCGLLQYKYSKRRWHRAFEGLDWMLCDELELAVKTDGGISECLAR